MKNKLVLYFFLIVSFQLFAQNETYEVFNTSINSRFAELGISYLNDSTVIYASSKKTDNDKSFIVDRRKNNRQLFVDLYSGKIKGKDIVNEQKFTQEVDNKFYVSDISFTNDQKTVFFTWNNFYNTTSRKDSAKWKTLHIVKASINENLEILNLEHLPFNSSEYSVRSPELSKDESQLFFISDMPGGYGNTDIYVVDILENGAFSEPRNLGPNVNTKLPEMFPHAAENGNIYFSSYGHNSTGGLDIFKSNFINGIYEKAEKLPDPINTRVDDFAFVINEADNSGFFSSTRKKGKGDADIYSFIRIPLEVECFKEISGNVLNVNTKEQLSKVQIQLFLEGEIVEQITTSNDGFYSFKLSCDKDYTLEISKQYYEDSEVLLTTNDAFEDKTIENILLTPKDCNQQLNLEIVHQETSEILNDVTLKLFKNNEEIKTENLNNLNAITIDCNSKYKIVAEKNGFISNSISFITTKDYNNKLSQKIALTPLKCYQNFTGTIVDKITQQELTNLSAYLFANDVIIDEINLDSFKLNFTIDCNQEYMIKVEKANYKTTEFNISTTNELKKVIFKTIELEPLECNQNINISVVDNFLEPLTGALIQLYKNNEVIETIESSNKNSILEFDCENTYKIIVSKENYISQEYGFTTSRQYDLGLTKQFELVKKDCNQTISGNITNSENKDIISNAKVTLFRGNNPIQSVFTDENGNYNLNINCENDYKIVVEKADFVTSEYEFTTEKEFDKLLSKDILLAPVKCNQTITVSIINSISKELINEATISLLENDQLIETKESNGETSFKFVCKTGYKIVILKDNFLTKEYVFNTNNINEKYLKVTIELVEKECTQTISGVVSSSENNNAIANAKVSLFSDNNLIQTLFTDENGNYELNINCENEYKIVVEKADFVVYEYEFATEKDFDKLLSKSIQLAPVKCNQTIAINVINSISKELLNKVTISLFENDKLIETKESNDETSFDLICKSNYKIVVSKDNFFSKAFVFNTNNINENNLNETIELVEKECIQTISGIITDSEKELILPNTKVQILVDNNLMSSTFTNEKGEYQFKINCNTNYTILVVKPNYETVELEIKSTNEFDASIAKNIGIKAIPCNQLITGVLINDKNQEAVPNAVVKLFSNGSLITSKQTDTDGTYSFNIECSKTYKITGQHENFNLSEISISSDKLADSVINKNIELTPKICSQSLNIIIVNEDTNERLSNLDFTLSKDGQIIETISLKTIHLVLTIECNSTYKIAISKDNYINKVVEFTTNSEFYKKNSEIIKLEPLPCKQIIAGKVFDRKLNSPLQNTTIEVYSNSKLISTHNTDVNGGFRIELDCNLDYNIVTSVKDYLNDLKIITTNNEYNKEFELNIYLNNSESELFEEVENVRTVKMNPIVFALNESKITSLIAQELDKLIETLKKYPNLKLEVKNHTDSRAPDDYNLKLSEDRAQAIINYIVLNGIESSRVSGKGYGETALLNKCSNGIKCSEAEHQMNRRTEFIVTENE